MREIRSLEAGWLKLEALPKWELNQSAVENVDVVPHMTVLNDDGFPLGPFAICKDYIQDVVWAVKTNKSMYNVYGWKFDRSQITPPSLEKNFPVALLFKSEAWKPEDVDRFMANLRTLFNNIEERNGVDIERRSEFARQDNIIIGFLSLSWLQSIATVSFATYLLRNGIFIQSGNLDEILTCQKASNRDKEYIKYGEKFLNKFRADGFGGFNPDWQDKPYVEAVHGNGFLSYSRNQ